MIYVLLLGIIFIISISLHEYAHAWMSNRLWDPTPRLQGRLTPNPLVHIDPIWFLLIFLIWFGRGRPVLVNPAYYKNTLRDELLVALAGPATNLVLATFASVIMLAYGKIFGSGALLSAPNLVVEFRALFAHVNVALAVFNLLPIYPLDGYRIVKYLFPKAGYRMEENRQMITIALLLCIALPFTGNIIGKTIATVSDAIFGFIHAMVTLLFFF
jgi:Zn-dependent protease